jgi:hypothetical protein
VIAIAGVGGTAHALSKGEGFIPPAGGWGGQTDQNFGHGTTSIPATMSFVVSTKRRIFNLNIEWACKGSRKQRQVSYATPIRVKTKGKNVGSFKARFKATSYLESNLKESTATVRLKGRFEDPAGPPARGSFGSVSIRSGECRTGKLRFYIYKSSG